jgi:hypothetical protein
MRTRLGTIPHAMDIFLFFLLGLVQICCAADGSASASSSVSRFADGIPTTTTNSRASATSSQTAASTHTVQVGNGDHKFKPDSINAAKGDVSNKQGLLATPFGRVDMGCLLT